MKPEIGSSYIYGGDVVTVTEIDSTHCVIESVNGEERVRCSHLKEIDFLPTYGHFDGPMCFGY
jgi:hypothetical protein